MVALLSAHHLLHFNLSSYLQCSAVRLEGVVPTAITLQQFIKHG